VTNEEIAVTLKDHENEIKSLITPNESTFLLSVFHAMRKALSKHIKELMKLIKS